MKIELPLGNDSTRWVMVGFGVMVLFLGGILLAFVIVNNKPVCGVPVELITTQDGKIDTDGILVFENKEGQCLRMWQIEHRMEAWLMGQKNIHVGRIYSIQVAQPYPWQYRFYVEYQLLDDNLEKKGVGL